MTSKINLGLVAVVIGLGAASASGTAFARQAGHFGAGSMMMPDFATLDADGDGKVTQEEMQAHRQAEIAGMDVDGDGMISESELAGSMLARMQAMSQRIAAERIATQDSDGDGKLSAAEMQAPQMSERMFGRLDGDGDGALSEAEMDMAREKMADRMHDRKGKHMHKWFGWGSESDADN